VQGNTINLLHYPLRNEEKPLNTHDLLGHPQTSWWNKQHGTTSTSPSSSASTSPSPHQGPITRSMMRKIHMCLSQDDQVNHELFTLFTRAKEISKI